MTRQERMIINLYEVNIPGFVSNVWKNDELPKLTCERIGVNIWVDDKQARVYLQGVDGGITIGTLGLFNFDGVLRLLREFTSY